MTSTRQLAPAWLGILAGFSLTAAGAPRSALAQSSTNGDPFVALQTQVQQINAQVQGFETGLEDANVQIQELQAQLEDANTQIDQCKSQITDLTQTVLAQQEFIDSVVGRMKFEDGELVGLREMTLVGPTYFTNADGVLKVQIAGTAGGVVTIFGPDGPGPAIVSRGPVWVSADDNATALQVHGRARINGSPEEDTLQVFGRTRLVSLEPAGQFDPAVQVIGQAWFRPDEQLPITVLLNGVGTDITGWFQGPCRFYDPEDAREFSLFLDPERPVLLQREDGFVHELFSVEAHAGENSADVHADSFIGRTMHADNFITIGSP